MSRIMTKPTKWHVGPAKTQISPGGSESSLCDQWVATDPTFLHADSEDSDQTGRMPRLIWVFAGRTCHFVGFVLMRLIWWLPLAEEKVENCSPERLSNTWNSSQNRGYWSKYSTVLRNPITTLLSWQKFQPCFEYQQDFKYKMRRSTTNPTKCCCAQRRLRSAWASAQSD